MKSLLKTACILIFFGMITCADNEPLATQESAILISDSAPADKGDPFTVISASRVGGQMGLTVNYSGGC